MIERKIHFFGDAVDLENGDEIVTVPLQMYRDMRVVKLMDDEQIFREISRIHGC